MADALTGSAQAEDQQDGETAAEAFARVEGELALLRRAVERLATERTEVPEPIDYSETLGQMSSNITAIAQRVDMLTKGSAQAMSPIHIASQIVAAGSDTRQNDQRIIAEARAGLDQATRQLAGVMASARRGDEQNRWLAGTGVGGVIVGLVLWAALAGPIARAMPASWHWREERAARAMDMPMWEAGGRLLATADPTFYQQIIADEQIARSNRDTITGCQKAAKRAGDTVRCTIRVGSDQH